VESQSLNEQFSSQMRDFNMEWDNKIEEFYRQCQELEKDMIYRQTNEMSQLKDSLEKKIPQKLRPSKGQLDLKTQEMNLIKQRLFKEAEVVHKKFDTLEKKEKSEI